VIEEDVMASKRKRAVAEPESGGNAEMKARAARLIAVLDEFQALVPEYQRFDSKDARRVATFARFANGLTPQTLSAIAAETPGGEGVFDAVGGEEAFAFQAAMNPVAARLAVLSNDFQFTIDKKVADIGQQAMAVYAWAKKLASTPAGTALRPHLARMKRDVEKTLNRGRKKRPSETAAETEAPGEDQKDGK
jgi:hypothetical protein